MSRSKIRCGDLLVDRRDDKPLTHTVVYVAGEGVLVDRCVRGFGWALSVDQIRAVPWLSVQRPVIPSAALPPESEQP